MTKNITCEQIVAMGGGGFSMEPENPLLDRYILRLSKKETPKICFVPTASIVSPTINASVKAVARYTELSQQLHKSLAQKTDDFFSSARAACCS